jgi:hypothetical protein
LAVDPVSVSTVVKVPMKEPPALIKVPEIIGVVVPDFE